MSVCLPSCLLPPATFELAGQFYANQMEEPEVPEIFSSYEFREKISLVSGQSINALNGENLQMNSTFMRTII